ncbi:MAG: BatA domain-containing protein [Planctomycetes bacterium]|nr:BatA domain-containing protein [Planctomycetota bacterium]
MNLTFGNPALLFGAALFVVPLLIHLLNRRRYRTIRWAAQEFLQQAFQTTRRRMQLESLLLLLARCLLVLLLAFALAAPRAPRAGLMAMFGGQPRDVVLIVDTSYSMARGERDGDSPLLRAKERATKLVEALSEERGDRATLLTLASAPELFASPELAAVRERVQRLSPSFRGADLIRTLNRLSEEILAPSTTSREVYLFTDLQRTTFAPGRAVAADSEATPASALRQAAALNRASFTVVDVGDERASDDLAVEDLTVRPQNVVSGEVATFTATVRNFGNRERRGQKGTFALGGRREAGREVTFDVPASGVATVEFSTLGPAPGSSFVEFTLEPDELEADDHRALAFPVHEAVKVLVVDGDPKPDSRESRFLAEVLNPFPDPETMGTMFRPRVIDDRRFNLRQENLGDYDLIVLANVGRIDPDVAKDLETVVRAGRGLMLFLGDLVDLASWNEVLYRPDGTGLLPARLVEPVGDVAAAWDQALQLRVDDFSHPVLKLFEDESLRQNLRGRVRRFFKTEYGARDSASSTLIGLDDDPARPSPLVLEKGLGRGRVVLWTTTADDDWTDLPNLGFAFLPLMHELATWLTLPDLRRFNLEVSEVIRTTTRTVPNELVVTSPAGERTTLSDPPREQENGEFVLPPYAKTAEPGVYTMDLAFPLSGSGKDLGARQTRHFAVNVDVREGDLTRVPVDALSVLYPGVELKVVREIDVQKAASPDQTEGEFWRPIVIAALTLLVAEMLMAWWFGRARGGAA